MTQWDRDRLVVLKKALKKLIKQSQAAQELNVSAPQVRRLLRGLQEEGDKVVIHGSTWAAIETEGQPGYAGEDPRYSVARDVSGVRSDVWPASI
jgi:Homeodomain-like domain